MEKHEKSAVWKAIRWTETPPGLWIKPRKLAEAEADLEVLQLGVELRTLTAADLRDVRHAYIDLISTAVRHDIDPHPASVTMWGGDVDAKHQRPGVLATCATAHRGSIFVSRCMAPSWPERSGKVMRRELPGPHRVNAMKLGDLVGQRLGGRWVWQ